MKCSNLLQGISYWDNVREYCPRNAHSRHVGSGFYRTGFGSRFCRFLLFDQMSLFFDLRLLLHKRKATPVLLWHNPMRRHYAIRKRYKQACFYLENRLLPTPDRSKKAGIVAIHPASPHSGLSDYFPGKQALHTYFRLLHHPFLLRPTVQGIRATFDFAPSLDECSQYLQKE